eukprot:gene27450-36226_t
MTRNTFDPFRAQTCKNLQLFFNFTVIWEAVLFRDGSNWTLKTRLSCARAQEIPTEVGLSDSSVIGVCLERGGKISASKSREVKTLQKKVDMNSPSEISYSLGEKLELVATLYKDVSTGRFLDKSAKLILRELQKSNFFGLSFKGLGIYKFRLGQLAAQLGYEQSRTQTLLLPLDLFAGGSLRVTLTTAFLRNTSIMLNDGDDDDNMSVLSDMSDLSTAAIGATFDVPLSSAGVSDPHNQGNFLQKLGFQASDSASPNYEEEEEGNKADYFDEDCQEGLLNEVRRDIGGDLTEDEKEVSAASREAETQNIAHENLVKSKQKRIQASKEAFELYQKELNSRSLKIQSLEAELSKQAALSSAQILDLKTQVNVLEAALQRERASKSLLGSSDAAALSSMTSAVEVAEISSKYGRVAAELQIMNEDLKYYKLLKTEEMEAAQEAATAAVILRGEDRQPGGQISAGSRHGPAATPT